MNKSLVVKIEKNIAKQMIKTLIILLCSICLGFLLLYLVHLIPIERMHTNAKASKDMVQDYGRVVTNYVSTQLDNFTDSIMLNQAICPIETSVLDKVIGNWQVNYYQGYDQVKNLALYLEGESEYRYQGYPHYWGGWQTVLKPLLLVFDLGDIRILGMMLQSLCVVPIILGFVKRGQKRLIVPFFVTLLSLMPPAMALSLQLSDVYYITMLGIILLLWKYEEIEKSGFFYFFLGLGILTSYFDFLTYPFVTLGLPLLVWLSLRNGPPLKKIGEIILNSAMWCIGYVGMWSGKWIVGSILQPQAKLLEKALKSLTYRGSYHSSDGTLDLWDVLLKNMYAYIRKPYILLIGATIIVLVIIIFKTRASWKDRWKEKLSEAVLYVFVGLYPVAWYMIAANHSYEHAFMAYRELGIATFAGLCLLAQWGHIPSE